MEELIKAWLKTENFPMGKTLYLQYGKNIRLIAQLHQMYEANPRIMADLRSEFEKMIPKEEAELEEIQILSIDDFLSQSSQEAPDQAEAGTKTRTIFQNSPEKSSDLENRNAFLYNQRGLLSNRLKASKGNPSIIAENGKIIDDIEAIVSEMKENRQKIRNSGKAPEPVEVEDKIVVYMKDMNYTEAELRSMSYQELLSLREKIRQQLAKARKRAQHAKTSKGRADNEIKVKTKEREIELVDIIKREIKAHDKAD